MKKYLITLIIPVFFFSCSKQEKFREPDILLSKWAYAIKKMSYREYKKCEAFPKSRPVFREIYSNYYPDNITIIKIDNPDENDIRMDPDGHTFHHRKVYFEADEINRKTGKAVNKLKGDVLFIRFIKSKRKKEGWLMSNRTLMKMQVR